MRIVKYEKIFLSQNEADIWSNFYALLESLERGCENPDTINLVQKIQIHLNDLWEVIGDIE